MTNLTISDKYALATAIALLLLVLINSAVVMLVVSIIGLVAGLWVAQRGETRRVAWIAAAAFGVSLAFAIIALLR